MYFWVGGNGELTVWFKRDDPQIHPEMRTMHKDRAIAFVEALCQKHQVPASETVEHLAELKKFLGITA